MKDKVYLTLALIGFVILAIFVVKNYDIKQDDKVFGVDTYYIPQEVKSKTDSSIDLAQQMSGARRLTCPQTDIVKTSDHVFNVSTLTSNNYTNAFGAKVMFITLPGAGVESGANLKEGTALNKSLNMKGDLPRAGTFTMGDVWDFTDKDYVELIAPFNFKFNNVNTTDGTNIIIVNTKGSCRITFGNVANWFCAGTPGTTQVTKSGKEDNVTQWEDHIGNHHTVVGATTNASVAGGSARDIIGYAKADTTVTIEKYEGNQWVDMSLYDFLMTSSKK